MASLYTQRSRNVAKTWALMGSFLILVIGLGFLAAQYFGDSMFLYIAVGISIFMNISAYWFSDKVAIASAGAKPADGPEWLELNRIVENLAITAGLPKPKVYVIHDAAPNAFATGRNPQHSAIAVTTGLMQRLDRAELEGVIAHELSHIDNRDILVMTVAVVLVGFVSILADIFLRMGMYGGRDNDSKAGPIILVAAVVAMVVAPIAAQFMQFAVSRRREFLADTSGALLTRYPEGLASALIKISDYKAPMQHASSATAHLFISNPFGATSGAGKFVSNLFSTHPPIADRVAALREMRV